MTINIISNNTTLAMNIMENLSLFFQILFSSLKISCSFVSLYSILYCSSDSVNKCSDFKSISVLSKYFFVLS